LDKNFKAIASSIKPKETFNVFSHPPDLAILLSRPGKKANNANGSAIAMEKPRKPIIGPSLSFCLLTSISKFPIKGAVHENDTNTNVKAIKKIPLKLLRLAFESTVFVHDAGRVISNAPKKEIPNKTNNAKTKRLKTALLEIWYKVLLPKIIVRSRPKIVNIATIETEYNIAFFTPCILV
jgi:hypothetical protein